MSAQNNQPDWDKIAEKFDYWLPHIAPVGETLLTSLGAQPGERILDVASGTGEPALTLAGRMRDVEIVGTDAAEGMTRAASNKVAKLNLRNIRFVTMPAEKLDFADASFDRVLCRFGVMLFNDPLQGLREMRRVLKLSGRFALAVWSTPESMPTMHWTYQVMQRRLPEVLHPPLLKVTSLGTPGVLEQLLHEAGFAEFDVVAQRFDYSFASFDDFWSTLAASDVLKQQFDALPKHVRDEVRDEVALFARDFQHEGGLTIPHEYLLASGRR